MNTEAELPGGGMAQERYYVEYETAGPLWLVMQRGRRQSLADCVTEADAHLIAAALNSREGLVAALECLKDELRRRGGGGENWMHALADVADNALRDDALKSAASLGGGGE